MMTTDSSTNDIETGIEWLRDGKTFPFEGVVFRIDRSQTPSVLDVSSYSDFIHLENVHENEAKEKITRSKQIGEHLAQHYSMFSDIWNTLSKVYSFCYDYRTGAVLVATEKNDVFTWHKK